MGIIVSIININIDVRNVQDLKYANIIIKNNNAENAEDHKYVNIINKKLIARIAV